MTTSTSHELCLEEYGEVVIRIESQTRVYGTLLNADIDRTGLMLWPGRIAVCDWLARTEDLKGKRVLELGAGCGACSCVAAARGARQVMATDSGELSLAERNLERNFVPPCDFSVQSLRWGIDHPPSADIVIASDVVYPDLSDLALNGLLLTARRALKESSGFFVIGFMDRSARRILPRRFFRAVFHARILCCSLLPLPHTLPNAARGTRLFRFAFDYSQDAVLEDRQAWPLCLTALAVEAYPDIWDFSDSDRALFTSDTDLAEESPFPPDTLLV